jgi:cell division protein FtsL
LPKKPPKLDEYRRLAAEATALADASSLDHVREKHEMAAIQWATLAATEESRNDRWAAPAMWRAS